MFNVSIVRAGDALACCSTADTPTVHAPPCTATDGWSSAVGGAGVAQVRQAVAHSGERINRGFTQPGALPPAERYPALQRPRSSLKYSGVKHCYRGYFVPSVAP
eukprot:354988-Chlamydomonas_euryale.AAC.15